MLISDYPASCNASTCCVSVYNEKKTQSAQSCLRLGVVSSIHYLFCTVSQRIDKNSCPTLWISNLIQVCVIYICLACEPKLLCTLVYYCEFSQDVFEEIFTFLHRNCDKMRNCALLTLNSNVNFYLCIFDVKKTLQNLACLLL